jgi:hypothetical protein
MTLHSIQELIESVKNPVILLEGRRKVKPNDRDKLTRFAYNMAVTFPNITFRTGNADGSDTLFAKGVAEVDSTRIQYVVPYPGMKKKNRVEGADVLSLDQINKVEEEQVEYLTSSQSKSAASMIDYTKKNPKGMMAAKTKYLLRDTLKVTGSVSGNYHPPVAAFFYIDPADKYAGGTGHTIKVCEELEVPVFTQDDWESLFK